MNAAITAIGSYTPEKVLTNADLESMVDTTDEWIVKRTGIKERRIATHETTVDMACKAADAMINRFGVGVADVDFIIFCSSTPEHEMPSMASQVQTRLNILQAGSFDLSAACAGFTYGITLAQSMIASGQRTKVLVVASDVLSRHTDYTDRSTCILFGDAAATVLVEPVDGAGQFKQIFGTDGNQGHVLYLSDHAETINDAPVLNHNKIVQDGRKVFKWAVSRIADASKHLFDLNSLSPDDIDFFVPHSANLRIIEALAKRTGVPNSKILESIVSFGNTSATSVPLAIDLGLQDGKLKNGHLLAMIGFGGGLTYAGTMIHYMPVAQ